MAGDELSGESAQVLIVGHVGAKASRDALNHESDDPIVFLRVTTHNDIGLVVGSLVISVADVARQIDVKDLAEAIVTPGDVRIAVKHPRRHASPGVATGLSVLRDKPVSKLVQGFCRRGVCFQQTRYVLQRHTNTTIVPIAVTQKNIGEAFEAEKVRAAFIWFQHDMQNILRRIVLN